MRAARLRCVLTVLAALWGSASAAADLRFRTSDGTQLHVIEAGPRTAQTIVFVPGWTMPAWIFGPQIQAFSRRYHVLALDPRGQGESDIPAGGYDYGRRGQDIAEMIAAFTDRPVLLVGWSLGVLDSLAYVQQHGDGRIAGLVLIDNSVGEEPAPRIVVRPPQRGPRLEREEQMRRFVRGMFKAPPGEAYLDRLTETALRTPPDAAAALLNYRVPRSFWRQAIYTVRRPILYVVRPGFAGQAGNLAANHEWADTVIFPNAGHALFVDEAGRFGAVMQDFINRRVWP